MNCRNCNEKLKHSFVDLGFAPPSNAYVRAEEANLPELSYPLQVCVCENCWLVQTKDYVAADEMFSADYAYFSSVSSSWLKHASEYAGRIISKLSLNKTSHVIEIASNDGYLLKNFVAAGIPCLGIEPTTETASVAQEAGIAVLEEFFTSSLAEKLIEKGQQADLVIANNVLAHVPDIKDFIDGVSKVLKPSGVVTMEFPHLLKLIEHCQFDTIYHEHFSYLSLGVVESIFDAAGLDIFDVEELTTHGGSLRIYASKKSAQMTTLASVADVLMREHESGLQNLNTYLTFQPRIEKIKNDLLTFLIEQKQKGRTVVGYGAAAKGNTLLNYAGVKIDLLPAIYDAAISKQGKLMPGSHIPIYSPELIEQETPDFILLLPWNIRLEVEEQLSYLKSSKIVVAIPTLKVME